MEIIECIPQFRDASANGLVALKGYINFFQDIASVYWYKLGKGNDIIPEKYGLAWIYTKYRIHINKEADFSYKLKLSTALEEIRRHCLVNQLIRIERNDEILAEGRIESCLLNLEKQTISKTSDIELAQNLEEDTDIEVESFMRLAKDIENMTYSYSHEVRYSDLDKSHHMSNLKYIDLFLNAFENKFYEANFISDFEVHFVGQSYEKDLIEVFFRIEDNQVYLLAKKKDGDNVARAWMKIIKRS